MEIDDRALDVSPMAAHEELVTDRAGERAIRAAVVEDRDRTVALEPHAAKDRARAASAQASLRDQRGTVVRGLVEAREKLRIGHPIRAQPPAGATLDELDAGLDLEVQDRPPLPRLPAEGTARRTARERLLRNPGRSRRRHADRLGELLEHRHEARHPTGEGILSE